MAKGQKSCPKCNKSCGPRTKVCTCGHEFAFKPKKVYVNLEADKPTKRKLRNYVYAGPCPIKLNKFSDLNNWLEKIICKKSQGLSYSRKAIISFVLDSKLKLDEKKSAIEFIKSKMEEYPDAIQYERNLLIHYKSLKPPKKYFS